MIANRLFEDENIASTKVGSTIIAVVTTVVVVVMLCAVVLSAILFRKYCIMKKW